MEAMAPAMYGGTDWKRSAESRVETRGQYAYEQLSGGVFVAHGLSDGWHGEFEA